MRRFVPAGLLVLVLVLALVLTACGGSDSDSNAGESPGTNAPTGNTGDGSDPTDGGSAGNVTLPSDACTLLTSAEAEAAIGTNAEGIAATPRDDDGEVVLIGCTWGAIAGDDPAIAVQVGKPFGETQIDYLKQLTGAAAQSSEPIDIGENGKLLGTAFIPGGGGVGQAIIFDKGGKTVVVGLVRGEQANLEAAAKAVEANLS